MKPKLLKLTALLLLLSGIASTCNPENPDFPKDVSYQEYSLSGSCQWSNLPYNEKVIIINSQEELERYVSCNEESYPAINFSKQSLLLASGKTNSGVSEIAVTDLKQLSANLYKLNIEITLNHTDVIEPWCVALVVDKLGESNNVELEATIILPSNKCGIVEINEDEYLKMCASPDKNSINSSFKLLIENHTQKELIWGERYWLEYYEGSKWVPVKLDIIFTHIAYILKPDQKAEQQIFLSERNFQLTGKYRIYKDFDNSSGHGTITIYAEFEII